VRYQNNEPVLNLTPFITTNNNSVQHSSVLYSVKVNFIYLLFTVNWQPTFTLLCLTHQLTEWCSVHNEAQHLCRHYVSLISLCCCCTEHFDVNKPGCLSHSCFNVCKVNSSTNCGTEWHYCYCCCHPLLLIYQLQQLIWPTSIYSLTLNWPVPLCTTVTKARFSPR